MKNRIRNSQNRIRNSDKEKWTAKDMAYRPGGLSQSEPVAWVRNLTDPQPHCVTDLKYMSAADVDADVQYIPLYAPPQPDLAQVGEVGVWGEPKA